MKSPQNLEEILSRARGFVKLEEENSHYWGNVKGRELRQETFGKMEKDRSTMRDPKFHMQQGKACDKARLGRNKHQMVKPLRSYDPHDQVVSEV